MSTNEVLEKKKSHKLRLCDPKKDNPYVNQARLKTWYPQALCFDYNKEVKATGSWFDDKYKVPVVIVAMCEDTPER